MAWGSISLFAGFLEKENSLETLIVIFENVSPKGFFWLNMEKFQISFSTANSRYLQTAALKGSAFLACDNWENTQSKQGSALDAENERNLPSQVDR